MGWTGLLLLATCLLASNARADRGALSVEGGAGWTVLSQPAPYASPNATTVGGAPSFVLGGRYALSNALELAAWGFYEPQVSYFHNGVTLTTSDGAFPGTLSEQLTRFGALAGVHHLWGSVWRIDLGIELGWSHRSASKLDAIDDTVPNYPVDYGLELPAYAADDLVLSPVLGVEWAVGDHWGFSFMPRLELLLGRNRTWAFTAPLTFSWSWYL